MKEIPDFNAAVQSAEEWLDDITKRLGWHDRARAYLALLAALHALRDCLERDEAIYLGAHLPILLRGLYYEGWHRSRHTATRKRDAFLARIHDGVHRDPAIDPEQVARAVLALIAARLPAAEVEDAKTATPKELHNLWPS
jgi:uncharacterized protein (DUF2267 family)